MYWDKYLREDAYGTSSIEHVLSIRDLSFAQVREIYKRVTPWDRTQRLQGCSLAALFYEPSSRTVTSFASAMALEGGTPIIHNDMGLTSVAKGESFEDTLRTFAALVDVVVVRHPKTGLLQRTLADMQDEHTSFINAGDGIGEHPTQALSDLHFVYDTKDRDWEHFVMVGDLKHGRTVHSLALLIAKMEGAHNARRMDALADRTNPVKVHLVAPEALQMPQDILDELTRNGIAFEKHERMEEVIEIADVLYVTRVQRERFDHDWQYLKYKGSYVVDAALMQRAKEDMMLLHPLPRIDEITREVDKDPRAMYFKQVARGVEVRRALLRVLLEWVNEV